RDKLVTGVQTCALPISCQAGRPMSLRAKDVESRSGEADQGAGRRQEAGHARHNAPPRQGGDPEGVGTEPTARLRMVKVPAAEARSEERRVGKEGRDRGV